MNEATRNDIVQRFQAGQSQRQIARDLHLARSTVQGVLAGVAAQRAEGSVPPELRPRSRRRSQVDAYEELLRDWLRRHPRLTARRLWEELKAQGFTGGYKQVWLRVRELRPRPGKLPVIRFETGMEMEGKVERRVKRDQESWRLGNWLARAARYDFPLILRMMARSTRRSRKAMAKGGSPR
jgi:transposase